MAKDKLDLLERANGAQIGWFLADEQDFGTMLGDGADKDDPETQVAMDAIKLLPADLHPDSICAAGWEWTRVGAAKKALHVAREAVRLLNSAKPMPQWAAKALAEGWNPPKDWKP